MPEGNCGTGLSHSVYRTCCLLALSIRQNHAASLLPESTAEVKAMKEIFPVTKKGLKFLIEGSTVCTTAVINLSPWKTQQETQQGFVLL